MVKHLVSHGNSSALIIEKPILQLLKISPKTPLEITTDGKNLIVSPARAGDRTKKMKTALAKINKRHANTLKKLAA